MAVSGVSFPMIISAVCWIVNQLYKTFYVMYLYEVPCCPWPPNFNYFLKKYFWFILVSLPSLSRFTDHKPLEITSLHKSLDINFRSNLEDAYFIGADQPKNCKAFWQYISTRWSWYTAQSLIKCLCHPLPWGINVEWTCR